jgi:hypothetical protein
MRKLSVVIFTIALCASCVTTDSSRSFGERSHICTLIAAVEADAPLNELSQDEAARLEERARAVLVNGSQAVAPLVDAIGDEREQNRRLALLKVLFLLVDDASVEARKDYYVEIDKAARTLLGSDSRDDRYMGALLISLPTDNRFIPHVIDMLADPDEDNRSFAIAVLREIAARDMGFRADAPTDERAAAVKRWKSWWSSNRKREIYKQPPANPILRGLRFESSRIASNAGPYAVRVSDAGGEPIANAVVVYKYFFTTADGIGKTFQKRGASDERGKALLGAEAVTRGAEYIGAEIIISKRGYKQAGLKITRRLLTPNSFDVDVTLERE